MIQPPSGADEVYDWQEDPGTSHAFRCFRGPHVTIPADNPGGTRPWSEDIAVCVQGHQDADGTITRGITVHRLVGDDPITVDQARQLAVALLDAAQDVERAADPAKERP